MLREIPTSGEEVRHRPPILDELLPTNFLLEAALVSRGTFAVFFPGFDSGIVTEPF